MDKKILDAQRDHWERTFSKKAEMFGAEPSHPARKAVDAFKKAGCNRILELGGGQGRDTFHFAQNGFRVTVLDYSAPGLEAITRKAEELGLPGIDTRVHDVPTPLPFLD
jgi:cyclopropane fatty-acyl-phospholipid synthase-like methyltransferase